MNSNKYLLFVILFIFFQQQTFSQNNNNKKNTNKDKVILADECLPPTSFSFLDINNVNARINSGAQLWWDKQGSPQYEIPKGSGKHSLFSGSIWIGGKDVNGQLKVAGEVYNGYGVDYYSGPLSKVTATTDGATCNEYDKVYEINKSEVVDFVSWWNNKASYPNYKIPESIKNWPAHGNVSKNQSYYLAPFYDNNSDGDYNPEDGDYPYYNLTNQIISPTDTSYEGNGLLADQILKGDQSLWWIFNDAGNIHSESGGSPIGIEVRAKAYAYQTNDELNNMTFYSYEIINRSTYKINDSWFGFFMDVDLGYSYDDLVASDVSRGLGYCYNGDNNDNSGNGYIGYGSTPPAVGIDFYQGPYLDADGQDNLNFDSLGTQICGININGQNFGDGIIDNERFGMRKFMIISSSGGGGIPFSGLPKSDFAFYCYLKGMWLDNSSLMYGGNGHPNAMPSSYGPSCSFMYPNDSDPCLWNTNGLQPNGPVYWSEETASNVPYDRRFMSSTGPFTLESGGVNYITFGIPWAQANNRLASVELLKIVDDKVQRFFDNGFKIINGPAAPELIVKEMKNELIFYITNRKISNNYNENYQEWDSRIVSPDSLTQSQRYDSLYRFEGYQVYQLKDKNVCIDDLENPDKARLVFQCDIENFSSNGNPINRLINYEYSDDLNIEVPIEKVDGENAGISHSFKISKDKFTSNEDKLVNFKRYYYMAVAYAYNEYSKYTPNQNNNSGQKAPYLRSKSSVEGGNVSVITAIPHNPYPTGIINKSIYGNAPKITRIEGNGNGGNILDLTQTTIDTILSNPSHIGINLEYESLKGPIVVKIIDPFNVKKGTYVLKLNTNTNILDSATWTLINLTTNEQWKSDKAINIYNEQIILDVGISITIMQTENPGNPSINNNGLIESSIEFSNDSKKWLSGVKDVDEKSPLNWIRAGTLDDNSNFYNNDYDPGNNGKNWLDPNEVYENIIDGTWAPYRLCARGDENFSLYPEFSNGPAWKSSYFMMNKLKNLTSVDIVFTTDKTKWTRSPVIELCDDPALSEGNVKKFNLRDMPSVDKEGQPDGSSTRGMSWFPAYAINLETGERLNIMFGESSWLVGENGRDLIWNPTNNLFTDLGAPLLGGMHCVYIMGHNSNYVYDCPEYDEGEWLYKQFESTNFNPGNSVKGRIYKDVMWVGFPLSVDSVGWLSCDAKIRIRVTKPYRRYYAVQNGAISPENDDFPMYSFSLDNFIPIAANKNNFPNMLDNINIVPNPFIYYSNYEENKNSCLVKLTNLPKTCEIFIYTINGKLIRQISKNDILTYYDWDLKNNSSNYISSGLYLIQIKSEKWGEKILKWYGSMREIDGNDF